LTIAELLAALRARGVELSVADGKLRYRAPVGAINDDLRRAVADHRAELLTLLVPDLSWDALPGHWRIAFEERAAIRKYDGGLLRERAEALALADILEEMR
jgi:TubC N-terminal docking domain